MLIFSYGSNMCSSRLRNRVPSAVALGVGGLPGYQLRFHKRSADGSAKADAFRTGNPADCVWGVVFKIDPAHKVGLDACEGLGRGYSEFEVDVRMGSDAVRAQIYVADPAAIAEALVPYTWYMRYVLAGALEYKLPEDYIGRLREIVGRADPDLTRHEKEWISLPGECVVMGPRKQVIRSVDDWFAAAPPTGKVKQWVEGRSAMELQRAHSFRGWCGRDN